jgi:hypothetical protein
MRMIAALIFLICASVAGAQTKATEPIAAALDVRERCDAFVEPVALEKIQRAFDSLMPYAVFSEADASSLILQTIRQREMVEPEVGSRAGVEFLLEQRLGASLLRFKYLGKSEKHALVWTSFYSPDGQRWRLNGIDWNEEVHCIF